MFSPGSQSGCRPPIEDDANRISDARVQDAMSAKKRSPSAKDSLRDDARTAKCLYCDETKPLAAFNREHVLPEAFGKYEDNLVLHHRVCADCNTHLGRELDLPLARDSKEGLDRFEHNLVD